MKNIVGLLVVFLCGISLICSAQAFQKRRYGLASIFFVNALSHFIYGIQVFTGLLF